MTRFFVNGIMVELDELVEKAEKWDALKKRLASGVDGKGYDIRQVTMKGWDEIFGSWERLNAITKIVGLWSGYNYEGHPEICLEIQQLTKEILTVLKS